MKISGHMETLPPWLRLVFRSEGKSTPQILARTALERFFSFLTNLVLSLETQSNT